MPTSAPTAVATIIRQSATSQAQRQVIANHVSTTRAQDSAAPGTPFGDVYGARRVHRNTDCAGEDEIRAAMVAAVDD